jgi:hypothetical protein
MTLPWTRVMDGEYKAEPLTGWWYYVDHIHDGCPRCAHAHQFWQLSGGGGGLTGKLGEFRTMREAKAAAESHAKALAAGGA